MMLKKLDLQLRKGIVSTYHSVPSSVFKEL